jgi:hypothetical protein
LSTYSPQTGKDPSDVSAHDFDSLSAPRYSCAEPAWYKDVKVNLNRRLAHITTDRWRSDALYMNDYLAHTADVDALIAAFIENLKPETRF